MSPAYEPASAVMRVLELLFEEPLCEQCLDAVSGLTAGDLESALHRLIALVAVAAASAVCDRCRCLTDVFRVVR